MTEAAAKRARVIELHRDGRLSLADIGTVVGVTRQAVWSTLARAGVLIPVTREPSPVPPEPGTSPEEAGCRKLLEGYARYYETHVRVAE